MATVAAARPQVSVFSIDGRATKKCVRVPDVMLAPIRTDIVQFVHTNMAKNNRQPYGVMVHGGPKGKVAGMRPSAQSWGTGRAVARVPRVRGGGTHRAGQGAYANMCRGGRMFAPTKIWRRWHRKINTNQKRYAVCSAVAASAVPSLVMARGHRIQNVEEIPLIVDDSLQRLKKTRNAVKALQALHLGAELNRCKRRYKRAGRGKARNRRWKHRQGPLIVYGSNHGIVKAARNIRGIDFCRVDQLNLLKLCPGGHVGRLIVWTESAARKLNKIFGTQKKRSQKKHNYHMPRPLMTNSDLSRIINSQEIQSAIRPLRSIVRHEKKRNPLKKPELYARLNPHFEKEFLKNKKKYIETHTSTNKILKPLKKKQRVKINLTSDQKNQMQKYWNTVLGEEKIFKTRETLALERRAVALAIEKAEREKRGDDLQD